MLVLSISRIKTRNQSTVVHSLRVRHDCIRHRIQNSKLAVLVYKPRCCVGGIASELTARSSHHRSPQTQPPKRYFLARRPAARSVVHSTWKTPAPGGAHHRTARVDPVRIRHRIIINVQGVKVPLAFRTKFSQHRSIGIGAKSHNPPVLLTPSTVVPRHCHLDR